MVGQWDEVDGSAVLTFAVDGSYAVGGAGVLSQEGTWVVVYDHTSETEYLYLHIAIERGTDVDYHELHPFEYVELVGGQADLPIFFADPEQPKITLLR